MRTRFRLVPVRDTAFQIFQSVRPKIDDYFTRCQLVAFDVRASDALNAPETIFAQLVDHALNTDDEAMRELPLAHIAADQPLPLEKGLNPAWRDQIIALKDTIAVPLLGVRDELTSDKWQTIKNVSPCMRNWLPASPKTVWKNSAWNVLENCSPATSRPVS